MHKRLLATTALCCNILPEHAGEKIGMYIKSCQNQDGGFKGRTEQSDLYYSLFALESLWALNCDFPTNSVRTFLSGIEEWENFDLVHLSCLARCYSILGKYELNPDISTSFQAELKKFRTPDGAASLQKQQETGSVYGSFLYCLTADALECKVENSDEMVAFVNSKMSVNGSFSGRKSQFDAVLPVTCAAVSVLHEFDQTVNKSTIDWLISMYADGGYKATYDAPVTDLLSTATALYTLHLCRFDISAINKDVMTFIQSMWSEDGGFYSAVSDAVTDCEFTFYALLSLGVLSNY